MQWKWNKSERWKTQNKTRKSWKCRRKKLKEKNNEIDNNKIKIQKYKITKIVKCNSLIYLYNVNSIKIKQLWMIFIKGWKMERDQEKH